MKRVVLSLLAFLLLNTFIIPQTCSLKSPLMPLHSGNRLMTYVYTSDFDGKIINKYYSKSTYGPDSLFPNNKIYTKYHNTLGQYAWYRNEGDSIVYSRFQDGDSTYINMGWMIDSIYTQWTGEIKTRIYIIKNDTIDYNGALRKRIEYIYSANTNGIIVEDFVQGWGVISYYSNYSYAPSDTYITVDYLEHDSLVSYLFYDSTGHYTYLYVGGQPTITPTFTENYALKILGVQADIEHLYDSYLYSNNRVTYKSFLDSAWVEYFYQKGDIKTDTFHLKLLNIYRSFKGTINPDISLLNLGYTLKCRVAAVDKAIIPNYVYSEFYSSKLVGIEDKEKIAYSYKLNNNYPNPFNPSTTISFEIPNDDRVTITVYDVLGNKVKTLLDEYRTKGINNVVFNADNLSSGIYFYQVKFRGKVLNGKMNLIK